MLTESSAVEGSSDLRAPRNAERVPSVVGMTVREAQSVLHRSGYGCAIAAERSGAEAGPRVVVEQDPKPNSKGFEAELVHLTVSKPFPEGRLPVDCDDQRE